MKYDDKNREGTTAHGPLYKYGLPVLTMAGRKCDDLVL